MGLDSTAITGVVDHFLPHLTRHRTEGSARPFILGISGLQGSGKSTWAALICRIFNEQHGIRAITLSLDDLYYDHDRLISIRDNNQDNGLLRTRGQPGTHDEALATALFESLKTSGTGPSQLRPVRVPVFDKSLFNGEGGRVPEAQWPEISSNLPPDVVIFEGWCVGFQPLPLEEIIQRRSSSSDSQNPPGRDSLNMPTRTLADHPLSHLSAINDNLARYCSSFMGPSHFDGLIHLSTDDLANVYRWRLEQEHTTRMSKGMSMSDAEVTRFVQGYMPAYELYLNRLSTNYFFGDGMTGQLHMKVTLDAERKACTVEEMK